MKSVGEIADTIVDDLLHAHLAKLPADQRKAAIMRLHGEGALDDGEVAYWFYVFGLKGQ